MATVVSVMDRPSFEADTDVIVVADPEARKLLWVPRDLWCERIENRVNRAFALGGHALLADALAEHGINASHGICLQPGAIESGLEGVEVRVPVHERMEFLYPLERHRPIEEGHKVVSFNPPVEHLRGERFNQWMGARFRNGAASSDLERIERQKVLVAAFLLEGFDFSRFVRPALPVSLSSTFAIQELSRASADWILDTLDDLVPDEVHGMKVLLRGGSRLLG